MTERFTDEGPFAEDEGPARQDHADLGGGTTADDRDGLLEAVFDGDDDDRPLDPDVDDDQVDSAEADERAAKEGTVDVEDLP